MKIRVKDIGENGLDVVEQIDAKLLDLTQDDYLQFIEPLNVSAHFQYIGDVIVMHADIVSKIKSYCAITLKDLEQEFKMHCEVEFEVSSNTEYIEVDDDIRQEVLLNLPTKLVSEDAPVMEVSETSLEQEVGKYDGPTHQPFADLDIKDLENK